MEVCQCVCTCASEDVMNFLWHLTIIHAALLVRFTYGFVCDAKNARCTKHTCSTRCRCLLVSLQQVVMTSSAAKRQHTDGTYKYKTVDTIRLPIFSEDICPSFSKSRIAHGNSTYSFVIKNIPSFTNVSRETFLFISPFLWICPQNYVIIVFKWTEIAIYWRFTAFSVLH